MKRNLGLLLIIPLIAIALLPATSSAGWDPRDKEATPSTGKSGNRAVDTAIARLKAKGPGLSIFFREAYGYAVFPNVGKAGMFIGGAYGEGEVYRKGRFIGTSSLTQLSIGLQLGGQTYTEIIFFKDKHALNKFTNSNFELGAQASAIAVTAGISADVDYNDGVAVFTLPKQGLMYEAAVAGQKFSFEPAK
ncbi:MAG: lipid-binding SYLF domain-containing protein [Sedimenticola sp.]